eukprot:4294862-Prymnesium_polylepis.1
MRRCAKSKRALSGCIAAEHTPAGEDGTSDCACARGRRVRGRRVYSCNVRALALSVAHSRPCASVVVLSCKKDGPGGT